MDEVNNASPVVGGRINNWLREQEQAMTQTVTINTTADRDMQSICRQAFIEYHDAVNQRRHYYQSLLDDMTNSSEPHRDIALVTERIQYFTERYERIYDLLIAVDHGNITITYEDDGDF